MFTEHPQSPLSVFAQCAICVMLFLKMIYFLCCVCACVHTHTCTCTPCMLVPWRPEEGLGCSEAGVIGGSEQSNMDSGN